MAVSFFGLAFFFVGIFVFWNIVSTNMDTIWTGSSVGPSIKNHAQDGVNTFDGVILFVWVALHLGVLITSYLLRTHPVMYILGIFICALVVMVSVPLSNAYEEMQTNTHLSGAISNLPFTSFIISHLPTFELIWTFITLIVLYGSANSEGIL